MKKRQNETHFVQTERGLRHDISCSQGGEFEESFLGYSAM
jgi:hypothetical protein